MTTFDLYLFGRREGEGIVLRTPGGKYGVIDCATGSKSKQKHNALLSFLDQQQVKELDFLAFTHPHDDHMSGVAQVARAFLGPGRRLKRYCHPHFSFRDVEADALALERRGGADEARLSRINRNSLRQIQDTMFDAAGHKERPARVRQLTAAGVSRQFLVKEPEHDFSVEVIAPDFEDTKEFSVSSVTKARGAGASPGEQAAAGTRRYNLISTVLRVKFGEHYAVLGGDAERPTWERLLRRPAFVESLGKCVLFKVAHHGSDTGSFDELWKHVPRGCTCLLTCYTRQGIPNRTGLAPILGRGLKLYASNVSDVARMARFGSLTEIRKAHPAPVTEEVPPSDDAVYLHASVGANGGCLVSSSHRAAGLVTPDVLGPA